MIKVKPMKRRKGTLAKKRKGAIRWTRAEIKFLKAYHACKTLTTELNSLLKKSR